MNKKGNLWIGKLVSITLIIVVLFILYMLIPSKVLDTGKDFFENIWGDEEYIVDYEEADKNTKSGFDLLITEINKCKNTKSKTPCLCSVNLNAFYSIYKLSLGDNKIELRNIKGGGNLLVKRGETPQMNCYVNTKGEEEHTDELIFEKIGKPKVNVEKGAIENLFDKEEYYVNPRMHNLMKVLDSKICWVLESASVQDMIACETRTP